MWHAWLPGLSTTSWCPRRARLPSWEHPQKSSNHLLITFTVHSIMVDIVTYSHHHGQVDQSFNLERPWYNPGWCPQNQQYLRTVELSPREAFRSHPSRYMEIHWKSAQINPWMQLPYSVIVLAIRRPSAKDGRRAFILQAKLHKLCSHNSQDIKTIAEVLGIVSHCVCRKSLLIRFIHGLVRNGKIVSN